MDTCYFLSKQRTRGGGRAASALFPSTLQKESPSPLRWPDQAGQGKEAACEGLLCAGGSPAHTHQLPALELQVRRELQSGWHQATASVVSSPHLPPFLSTL